jgi:membrane protein YdbS with pleckstrin-like domain
MEYENANTRKRFGSCHAKQSAVYAWVDSGHRLSFVPSVYNCIPAMLRTWILLLVIVAGYGLFKHMAMGPDLRPSPTKQIHVRNRIHSPPPLSSVPLSSIPPELYFAAAAGVVLLRFGWLILACKSRSTTIEPDRLTFRRGVLNREVRSLEMTRVKNVSSYQQWWQRPLGIGTVSIESTDRENRVFLMEGVAAPHDLRARILRAGVASRQYYGTRETWVSGF